tara:strand:+ start:695 stop:934 length:240 start_codon:yes stop_codon:yes gene_type:complete
MKRVKVHGISIERALQEERCPRCGESPRAFSVVGKGGIHVRLIDIDVYHDVCAPLRVRKLDSSDVFWVCGGGHSWKGEQ